MPWRVLVFAFALVLALLMVATPPTPSAHAEEEPTTLTVAVVDPTVDSLNPFTSIYRLPTQIHRLMYDYLTMYSSEDATPTEGLAESWENSEDGLTWTYTIRDDSTFTDGEPVTAEDVAYTYNTIMADDSGAMANGSYVENFESVTATDEHTVEIKLKQPSASMLAIDIPIVPQHVWENVDNIAKFSNEEEYPIVGNGPWTLTDYQRNESITLEANEDYWRGAPGFDRLIFRFYKDQDAVVEALRKGEVSFVSGLTALQAQALESEDDIHVNHAVGKRFAGLTMNPGAEAKNGEPIGDGNPALKDPQVRTAILHAIDRTAIEERVYSGNFEANGSYIPSRYGDFHWEPEESEVIGYDPDEANRILDEAGYEPGDDGIRVSPDGVRLNLRQFVHADDPEYRQIATFMEEWLAEIGIEVETTPSDDIGGILDSGEFDLLFTGWTVNPDPDYIFSIQTCGVRPAEPGADYQSDSYNCNPTYDELYAQQQTEIDPEARAEVVQEMQKVLYEDGVVVIFGYPDMLEAYRTDVIEEDSPQRQPAENGNIDGQDGYWGWWSAEPASAGGGGGSDDDSVGTAVLAVGAGVVVLGALGGFLLMRRRSATADERK
ncbi:MAG TPA: ABC transporter substrate-binding protein [Nocardioides sp.]|nr:ABC transporter substrate-binding protein [Nocardioides sp.]